MTDTPRLGLPEIVESQASKHITHNEALKTLDALVQAAIQRQDLDAPPGSPSNGQLWIVSYLAWDVVAVDTTNEVVDISGDQTGRIATNDAFQIAGSTGNDGAYTVSSLTYNSTSGNTEITVAEDLTSSTADGEVRHAADAWNGHVRELAQYDNGWAFYAPWIGLRVWDINQDLPYRWNGDAWVMQGGQLDALTDVDSASPSDADLLQYNALDGVWRAVAVQGSRFSAHKFSAAESWMVASLEAPRIVQVTTGVQGLTVGGLACEETPTLPTSSIIASLEMERQSACMDRAVTGNLVTVESGTIYVHDGLSTTIIRSFDQSWTKGVTVNAEGDLLFVTHDFSVPWIALQDGLTGSTKEWLEDPATEWTYAIAWDHNTGELFLANDDTGEITVLDGFSSTILRTMTLPNWGSDEDLEDIDLANGWLYVGIDDGNTNKLAHQVGVYDAGDLSEIRRIEIDDYQNRSIFFDGTHVWTGHDFDTPMALRKLANETVVRESFDLLTQNPAVLERQFCRITASPQTWPVTGVDTGAETFTLDGDQSGVFAAGDGIDVSGSTGNDGAYTLTARSWSVAAVDAAADHFTVSGDQTAYFAAGETFDVSGSTGNNGTYTLTSRSWAVAAVDTAADTVTVAGDRTGYLGSGYPITISGSTGNDGTYTLTSRSWAVVAVDTTGEVVEVSGDQTAYFGAGESFQISGSTGNDGTYTVSSVTYNDTSGNTEITVNEDLTDSTADGSVDLPAVRYYSGSDETQIQVAEDLTDSTADGSVVIDAARYDSGSDETQLQVSEDVTDATADGQIEMWKGTAYAAVNWAS